MSQEIEIEFKTLLHQTKFDQLLQSLSFPNKPEVQTNYYFETQDFDLKDNKSALRIREKDGNYTLTLKQPHPEGILETHDSLTEEEFAKWSQGEPIRKTHTGKQLDEMKIAVEDMHYYGALKTERYSFQKDNIIYVLDKSFYHQIIDYELEIEATNHTQGEEAFSSLLHEFHITKQEPITKIERFFRAFDKLK